MGRASGGSSMPPWIRNILHFKRAMSMKIEVENGKICNKMTMRERLQRIGEAWTDDETDGVRLDFV